MKSSKCKRTIKCDCKRLSKRVETNSLEKKRKKKNIQSKNQNSDSNLNHQRLLKDAELDHFEPEILKIFEEYYLHNGFHTPIPDDDEIETIDEDTQVSTTTEGTSFVKSKMDALQSTDPMVGFHTPVQDGRLDDEIETIEEDTQVSTTTEYTSFVKSTTDALQSTDPMVGIDNQAPDQINFISTSG